MRFFAQNHLKTTKEFKNVQFRGQRRNCGCFIFQLLDRSGEPPSPSFFYSRLGVIASKKVGNAVKRNKAKRWFREIFRKNQTILNKSYDIVIVVFSNFDSYSYQELEKRFLQAAQLLTQHEESN